MEKENTQNASKTKFAKLKEKIFAIDTNHVKIFLPAKLCYFGFEASLGCIIPFLTVFLTSIGLSVTQSSLIAGFRTVASLILSPFLNAIADRTDRHKTILLLEIVATISVALPLPWIAQTLDETLATTNVTAGNGTAIENNLSPTSSWILFTVMLLMTSFLSVLFMSTAGFLDSAIMGLVAKHKSKTTFGNQRVFGSIGVASGSFFSGLLSDKFHLPEVSRYSPVFFVLLPHFLILFIAALFLEHSPVKPKKVLPRAFKRYDTFDEEEVKRSSSGKSVLQSTLSVCKQWQVIFVFIITVNNGINYATIPGFLSMHLTSIGSSRTEMGLAASIASMSAVVAFPISSRIMNLLGGAFPAFVVATFSYAVRYLIMGVVKIPSIIIAVQTLHSLGFALFWVALVEYIHKVSPLNICTTMFGIVNTLYYSLGILMGNIFGGMIFARYGGEVLFQVLSISSLVMSCFILIYHFIDKRRQKNTEVNGFLKNGKNNEIFEHI